MTVAPTVSKAGYAAPKLVVYGGMAALTASGSGLTTESKANNLCGTTRQVAGAPGQRC